MRVETRIVGAFIFQFHGDIEPLRVNLGNDLLKHQIAGGDARRKLVQGRAIRLGGADKIAAPKIRFCDEHSEFGMRLASGQLLARFAREARGVAILTALPRCVGKDFVREAFQL